MINLIQPITVQQAYDGITHARRWASWNWWWRMVDDDDGDGFPSPEPRTDSRSALPRGFRAWRRLRIVKRDETFSPIFSPRKPIYGVGVGVGGPPGGPRGRGARPPPSWAPCCSTDVLLPPIYTYVPPTDQTRSQKPNSTTATFCIHEIPSWGLFRSFAGGGIDHGGLLHQHHSPSDDVWVVYLRPSGP